MGQKLAEAWVEVRGDSSKLPGDLNRGTKQIASWGAGLTGKLGGMLAGFATIGTAIAGINRGIADFTEADQMAQSLRDVLKATGRDAEFTAEKLIDLSSELQAATTINDEAWQGSMRTMLRFDKVTGQTFHRAIKASGDLAIAFGKGPGGVAGMAQLVGMALQSPEHGLKRLRKLGVTFTKEQEKQIANYVKMGDRQKAQEVILKAIESKAAGAAEGAAGTRTGRYQQAKNALGDAFEGLGKAAMPFLTIGTNLLTEFLNGLNMLLAPLGHIAQAFVELDKMTGGWISKLLMIGTPGGIFNVISSAVKSIWKWLSSYPGVTEAWEKAVNSVKYAFYTILDALKPIWELIKSIGSAILDVVGAAFGIGDWGDFFRGLAEMIKFALNMFSAFVQDMADLFSVLLMNWEKALKAFSLQFQATMLEMQSGIMKAVSFGRFGGPQAQEAQKLRVAAAGLFGELVGAFAAFAAKRKERWDKLFGKPPPKPKDEEDKLKFEDMLPEGFMPFQDLNRKLQEQLVKNKDDVMIEHLGGIALNTKMQLEELKGIAKKVGPVPVPVA